MVNEKLIVAGFGGQGVLMIGKMVALSGMENGMEVSWLPAYGSEMRGGTATCSVNVSDEPVDSPMIQNPTALIIMNLPSLLKYESWAVPGAKVIINSSLVEQETTRTDIEVYKVPFNDLATQAGNERGMNMLVAGTYAAITGSITCRTCTMPSTTPLWIPRPNLLRATSEWPSWALTMQKSTFPSEGDLHV